ncbi:MAG: MFS transporter [Microbacteriaceae bacterium]|nr:MAG: MFS transporter [Microbacteriaceae bacterium]
MFSSLKVPNFRLYAGSQVLSTTARGMQRVVQDWLVLELTGSVTAVGVTVAMQFAPTLFFGLYGGVIADRYRKRPLLIVTQSLGAVIAATLALLILTGSIQVWQIWALAFVLGLDTVIDNPARQVFVNEIVGPRNLSNAISLNSSTFQLGSLIGPALAGVAITAVGSGWAFVFNAGAYAVVVLALIAMNPAELIRAPKIPHSKGQLIEGLRYAVKKPPIRYTLIVLAAVATFAYNMPVILTAFANTVFKVGAGGYGMFNALVAAGALAGALASTRRIHVGLRTTIFGAMALGSIQACAGLMPSIATFALLIIAAGASSMLFLTAANTLIQTSSSLSIRGRVMALYVLVQLGGQAVGGPIMGWLIEQLGADSGMVISGLVPLFVASTTGILIARKQRLTVALCWRTLRPGLAIVARHPPHSHNAHSRQRHSQAHSRQVRIQG